ncbi:MAG: glycosyltransferase family 4 protein [Desulfobacteraceae bacterium]|jgi:glycosyltransferase involved in cell wall biosynthesis
MKICFVALNILPYLKKGNPAKTAGGAELQQKLIGEALKLRGYEVCYISKNYGQDEIVTLNGFKVIRSFRKGGGIPGLRFFHPTISRLWKALLRADADIYYVRCADFMPGLVAIFCKIYKKRFVFAGANDTDFIPEHLKLMRSIHKVLYLYGLKCADRRIVQSNAQRKLLWENFRLHGNVVRNVGIKGVKLTSPSSRRYILWVSTLRPLKRPLMFINLAMAFQNEQFVMIGGPAQGEQVLYDEVERAARGLQNLKFLGFQPFEETEKYFDKSMIFVNTSIYEGFPNTFLQAWRRGIPVISSVDPDGVVMANKLGHVFDNEENMKAALNISLSQSNVTRDGTIETITDYYQKFHVEGIIEQYHSIFERIVCGKKHSSFIS